MLSDLNDDKEFFENQIARLEKENRKLNKCIANLRLDFVLMLTNKKRR